MSTIRMAEEEPGPETGQDDNDAPGKSDEPAGSDETAEGDDAARGNDTETAKTPEDLLDGAETINAYAPAAGLTGEQFYREDFEYPPEPPDPRTAICGKEDQQQTDAGQFQEDQRGRLERIKASLRTFRNSLASSTWSLLKKGAAAALELCVVWAVIYVSLILVLEVLTPLGAFAGLWKVVAVAVVLCALLRARLARRRGRFLAGVLVPGKK